MYVPVYVTYVCVRKYEPTGYTIYFQFISIINVYTFPAGLLLIIRRHYFVYTAVVIRVCQAFMLVGCWQDHPCPANMYVCVYVCMSYVYVMYVRTCVCNVYMYVCVYVYTRICMYVVYPDVAVFFLIVMITFSLP